MQLTTVLVSTQLGDWQPSCACRVVKCLQAELKQCRGHTLDGTASVSKGIRALVLDVCGVLKHFDQVRCILRCHTLYVMPLFHSKHCMMRQYVRALQCFARMLQIGRSFALPQLPEELQEEFALVGAQLCGSTGRIRRSHVLQDLHTLSALYHVNVECVCPQMSFCYSKQTVH